MEDFEYKALLFDFYGALLTEKQKNTYEDHVCNDLSLTEIAQNQNISRQAAHDMIKKASIILEEYEAKLKLISRFLTIKEHAAKIEKLSDEQGSNEIKLLAQKILEEL